MFGINGSTDNNSAAPASNNGPMPGYDAVFPTESPQSLPQPQPSGPPSMPMMPTVPTHDLPSPGMQPMHPPMPSHPVHPAPPTDQPQEDLIDIKQQALQKLAPLVGQLQQSAEEKFKTTMMMLQASDNPALVREAYTAANEITDDKARAQALLDVVNEINYFTHQEPQDSPAN